MGERMRFRADIDGLRALAVLPVVLFHVEVPGFSGGFVGVDIFFVISGYLITGLITEEIKTDTFTIASFYERRARRILPALFLVLAVSSVAAAMLFLPARFAKFSESLLYTVAFASNVHFSQALGYFGDAARHSPLLHTWSLAVEEQFYIAFPLVLAAIRRWGGGRFVLWLVPIAVLSFAGSAWSVVHQPVDAFYLAPSRAWELLLGALLALGAVPDIRSERLRNAMGLAGLAMVAIAVARYSRETPFPGPTALLPCAGAALILLAGRGRSWSGALLATGPLILIGRISYSLYLWHWPVLVFAAPMKSELGQPVFDIAVIGLSFAAAWASWRFVEAPFRRRTRFGRRTIFVAAASGLVLFAGAGQFGHLTRGWPQRLPARVATLDSYVKARTHNWKGCVAERSNRVPPGKACTFGANVPASIAVWGDSHAAALVPGVAKVAARHGDGVKLFAMGGCPPLLGVERSDWGGTHCLTHNRQVLQALRENSVIDTVVLVARYALYVEGYTGDLGPAEADAGQPPQIAAAGRKASSPSPRKLLAKHLRKTVKALRAAGKRVALVYPVPETGYDEPQHLARLALYRRDPSSFTRPESYYRKRQRFVVKALDSLGRAPGIVRIHPAKRLCNGKACIVMASGKPLYFDDDHLSIAGAAYISPLFKRLFTGDGTAEASRG